VECGILLGVGKGSNMIIKQVSLLVDSDVVACQFMFLMCFGKLCNWNANVCIAL